MDKRHSIKTETSSDLSSHCCQESFSKAFKHPPHIPLIVWGAVHRWVQAEFEILTCWSGLREMEHEISSIASRKNVRPVLIKIDRSPFTEKKQYLSCYEYLLHKYELRNGTSATCIFLTSYLQIKVTFA